MIYKIWDNQLTQYSFQEHIFKNKKEAVDQLISFFSVDCGGDLTKIRGELWSGGEFAELEIQKILSYKGYEYEFYYGGYKIYFKDGKILEFSPYAGNTLLNLPQEEREEKLKSKIRYKINKHLTEMKGGLK